MTTTEQPPVTLMFLCGSLRTASINMGLLRTALRLLPVNADATVFTGMADLPHFNPDDDHDPLPAAVVGLRDSLRAADAILICAPEYAGGLPGSFKNLLDWTVGGQEVESSVAWINVSTAATGARGAHQSLRAVLGYTGAHVVDSACRNIPVRRDMVSSMGDITDAAVRGQVSDVLVELVRHATAGASA